MRRIAPQDGSDKLTGRLEILLWPQRRSPPVYNLKRRVVQAMGTVLELVERLRQTPEAVATSQTKLPKVGGFYAWWARRGSIAGVPSHPHPMSADLDLFYVGIAPVNPSSSATIYSRVRGNHLGGNIAASTFRFTLAALLQKELQLRAVRRGTKIVLTAEDNERLSTWQRENLWLSWQPRSEPWDIEAYVIAQLEPPLNLATNGAHPFYATVKSARARLRELAR